MSNLTVENVYTRHTAKELAKKHFWKLLGMTLTVAVIIFAIMFGGMTLLTMATGASVSTSSSSVSVTASADAFDSTAFMVGYLVLMVVMMLVSGGLSLGMTAAMIDLCRGNENVTVSRVFSRMGQCLKAFGLSLWVGLKTFLWMLPGYAAILIACFVILGTVDSNSAASVEAAFTALTILPFAGMILIFCLAIPAAYRYIMSSYVLADKPGTGIRACVSESKAMMKGHKWQAFKLVIPTILLLYAVIFGVTLVMSFLTALLIDAVPVLGVILVIAMIVGILFLALYFVIRIALAYCLFYLKRCKELNPAEESVQEGTEAATEE